MFLVNLIMIRSTSFFIILFSIILRIIEAKENDFNCPDECGLYSPQDTVGPHLHEGCKAMEESAECVAKFVDKTKKKKKKKKKKADTRIVGGVETKYPMPWMVLIVTETDGGPSTCGGTLINSQFVLSACHCFCNGQQLDCTREIGEIGKEPVKIKGDVGKKVKVYAGKTKNGGGGVEVGEIPKTKDTENTYSVEKIFIHPLLGTDDKHMNNPDMSLIKLARQVQSFSDLVRPICLSTKDTQERPICPDMSRDKPATKEEKDKKKDPGGGGKILGGCATVAGWGHRYDHQDVEYGTCMTDFSDMGPDKIAHCNVTKWHLNGKEITNCTKENIPTNDLTNPCKFFTQELEFNKALHKTNSSKARYRRLDINDLSRKYKSPIEVVIKTKKRKRIYHCGMTKFSSAEKSKINGWCATKLDRKDKIERWGFCNSACKDSSTAFLYANINILNDDECQLLDKYATEKNGNNSLYWNREYELCVGKKHQFPKKTVTFKRSKKKSKTKKKERKEAKQLGLPSGYKPTKYQYTMSNKFNKVSLGTPEDYPYDWFLGGVDTCQGDSGGPLWRNVKDGEKTRATQIGVVSRGHGCALFNSPAIFGSVKMAFGWIKEIVEKEMSGKGYCPKK